MAPNDTGHVSHFMSHLSSVLGHLESCKPWDSTACTTSDSNTQTPAAPGSDTTSTFDPSPSADSQPLAESSSVGSSDAVPSLGSTPATTVSSAFQTSPALPSPSPSLPLPPSFTPLPPSSTSSDDSTSSSEPVSVDEPSATSTALAESTFARNKTNAGAIAGGVIGGVIFLLLLLLLVFFRKSLVQRLQHARRKRTAPSAEFVNVSPQLYSSQSRLTGLSPTPGAAGHYRGNSTFSARDLQGMAESPVDDENPPPFTPGAFKDPVIEKVASSARQHEMYLQAHRSSPPSQDDHSNEDGSSLYNPHSRNPYILPHPFEQSPNYPLDTSDFPATSPILMSEDHSSVAGPSRSATGHRGQRSPGSAEAGWAV
ncbi:hypothetical protein PsYK624_030230 [Phanerochaete sordida]|uniref:Uncharacterized protein n=1 Tax=Phanerochaete sordida TaxID=48140 RepID=A0A9P3G3G1_9APHY|nr:hypothetical protein PsYK624_030230 [Phanerochaete sordida]